MPEPSAFEVELVTEKLKSHRSPGIDHIPAEMIKAGGRISHSEIHKFNNSIWNKEGLPEEWKSITVPNYKKGDKTECRNYKGTSLLPTTYKILSNIQMSRLTPYAEQIMRDHQRGIQCKKSITDYIFCICQILEKKQEYKFVVHHIFIVFKKAYDSVRREVLYKILFEFGIPMKLVMLIKMCLNETYIRVWVGKHLSDMFPMRNGLKQGDGLSPMISTVFWSTLLGGFR